MSAKNKISILGSTGSIGLNALAVIDALAERFELVSASAHQKWQILAEQARKYDLKQVVLTDTRELGKLQSALQGTATEVLGGPECMIELATDAECATIVVAVVGAAGLPAVKAAIEAGKTVAIANKESLVNAGCLLMPLARKCGARVLPIDSEHSAILQAMLAGAGKEISKVIITASGGPFRTASREELARATVEDALNHPTWNMGPKVTIDSATMMNKALEIIEARWLFDLDPDKIEVLVHPESIIHSLVEFCDGSVIAQMSPPDMRLPIQYALTYPQRLPGPANRLKLHELRKLSFEPPDVEKFPAIRLGFEVARMGGTAGAVLNAANEAAVEAFREGKINFLQITQLVEEVLHKHKLIAEPNLQQLMQVDRWARYELQRCMDVTAQS